MVARVGTQGSKRELNIEPSPPGDHPLGLLDHDAAVERMLKLLVEDLGFYRGPVLKDGDGGHVSQGLGALDVGC